MIPAPTGSAYIATSAPATTENRYVDSHISNSKGGFYYIDGNWFSFYNYLRAIPTKVAAEDGSAKICNWIRRNSCTINVTNW